MRVADISSTFYGGGVTELLTPLTLMMNANGIETDRHLFRERRASSAAPRSFTTHCKAERDLSDAERRSTRRSCSKTRRGFISDDCDAVIVHDPQPLPLSGIRGSGNAVDLAMSRRSFVALPAGVDLSAPVHRAIRRGIFSLPEYGQHLRVGQQFVTPAIDPFSAKNCELSDREIREFLATTKFRQIVRW